MTVTLLSIVALIVAWKALQRSAEIERLAARVLELEAQLRALRVVASPAEDATPVRGLETAPAPPPTFAAATPLPASSPTLAAQSAQPASGPPSTAPPPALPPRAPALQIDWEQWIGIRGAAVLGGVVLALAGVYLFRYSIEHGLVPPWLRVVFGLTGGAACIAASEWWLRRRYAWTADAVAGAGVVILYASLWGAYVLYKLVGVEPAFAAMILVTVACCALSWRHASLVIALIGLTGGFLTPMLLSTGSDRPIGLFTYVLLLDVGMLYIAFRREWPLLAVLSLCGTFLYQAGWILTRMDAERAWLGIGILTVFAAVFGVSGNRVGERRDPVWLITQAGGVLLPFGFAAYFAINAELSPHLYPLALMMLLLGGGAAWISRAQAEWRLGLAAAAAIVAVVAAWLMTHELTTALAWETVALSVALAACFHLFVEIDRESWGWEGPAPAALTANLGLFFFLMMGATKVSWVPWPWIAGWAALAALLLRHAGFPQRDALSQVAAAALGLSLAALSVAMSALGAGSIHLIPEIREYLGILVALAVAFQFVALLPAGAERRRWRERGAATLALLLLLSFVMPGFPQRLPPALVLGGMTLLGSLAALAATRLPSGAWLLGATAATAAAHGIWCVIVGTVAYDTARLALLLQLATAQLFAVWPFLFGARLRSERWAWNAAALSGALWFLQLRWLFEHTFGDSYIGALPLMLAVTALTAAAKVRELWPDDEAWRQTRLAWFLTFAMGFIAVAIPLQLDKSWITVGWALQAAAVVLLWQRIDHPGLKYFAVTLFAAVTVRLVLNPAVLGYYPRPEWRVINWLLYTYLVPAGALLWGAAVLSHHEVKRARPSEAEVYRFGQPVGALFAGFAAISVIFVWINLTIADWFATGTLQVTVTEWLHAPRVDGTAARDLAMSIAWALYALVLLAAGVRLDNRGVRWVSLALMMVTIVKVFLYDLGELRDLYRVASLLGLALSLIAVSLAYQRFVARKPLEEAP
jgi:uncharacterized membrane protein